MVSKKLSNKIHGLKTQEAIDFKTKIPGQRQQLQIKIDNSQERLHTQDLGHTTHLPGR